MAEASFFDNESKSRYELHVEGHVAFLDYMVNNEGTVCLTHTEVPRTLEGRGVGSELITRSFTYIQNMNRMVCPLCPFVISYLGKHPEWNSIVKR